MVNFERKLQIRIQSTVRKINVAYEKIVLRVKFISTDSLDCYAKYDTTMIFIKAYQAYQQHNYDQCLKILQEVKQNDFKKLNLQAQAYLRKREYQKSYDIYVELLKKDTDNTSEYKDNIRTLIVCAQLEQPGILKVQPQDKVPSLDDIIGQVEMINLKHEDNLPIPQSAETTKKSKRQKKRRKRLPKQYDPVAGPDPERWLPRRDRKSNVHKKRRPKRRPVKGLK